MSKALMIKIPKHTLHALEVHGNTVAPFAAVQEHGIENVVAYISKRTKKSYSYRKVEDSSGSYFIIEEAGHTNENE